MTDSVDTRLGRIEGKLEAMITLQQEHNAQTAGLSARVTALERSKAYFLGVCATAGAVASYVITKLKGV